MNLVKWLRNKRGEGARCDSCEGAGAYVTCSDCNIDVCHDCVMWYAGDRICWDCLDRRDGNVAGGAEVLGRLGNNSIWSNRAKGFFRKPVQWGEKKKPVHEKYTTYRSVKIDKEELIVPVSEEVFFQMCQWELDNSGKEIGGAFVYDPENGIVWAHKDDQADERPGHVESSTGEATVQALLAGYGIPNGQFHTHPGFSAYFSGEDVSDQAEFLWDAMKVNPAGYHLFMVFDQLQWRIRKVEWRDGKVHRIQDGWARVRDMNLDFDKWQATSSKTTWDYATRTPEKWWHQPLLLTDGISTIQVVDDEPDELDIYLPAWDEGRFFRGAWSDNDEDYRGLFDIFGLQVGQWSVLYDEIADYFGTHRFQEIVDNPELWQGGLI